MDECTQFTPTEFFLNYCKERNLVTEKSHNKHYGTIQYKIDWKEVEKYWPKKNAGIQRIIDTKKEEIDLLKDDIEYTKQELGNKETQLKIMEEELQKLEKKCEKY